MTREELKNAIRTGIKCADYLQKSKGNLYCCPFCGSGTGNHGTGALKVYDTNTWTCHACSKSGDVIDIIQEVNGVDYNQALNIGADILHISIDSLERPQSGFNSASNKIAAATIKHENSTKQAVQQADYSNYYDQCRERLPQSQEAISYLAARGISLSAATIFGVGFDPEADPTGKGYKEPRLIIPTSKSHYVARRLINKGDNLDKMNPTGSTPGIFNLEGIYENKIVYITEGVFDALSFLEIGAAAIATNSTSNTKNLLAAIKEKPTGAKFIICFDNDPNPGTAARTAAKAAELQAGLEELGNKCIIFDISKYAVAGEKDINDILKRDPGTVEQIALDAEYILNRDSLTDFLEKIQTEAYKPYKTDLGFFDSLLGGGVIQQSLLLLMAAPGTGKTTLCQQLAEAMAAHKKPVIYLNLEMSREQMYAKAISGRVSQNAAKGHGTAKTALEIMQGYNWTDQDRKAITGAIEEYRTQIHPYIQYNPAEIGSDLEQILEYLAREGDRAKATGKQAPAVILDYMHLVSSRKGLDVQELIKQTVTGLKDYAKRYDTFVVAIVATNRTSNGKITLSSGRDSSNIEYTGDYVLSLEYYDIDQGKVSADNVDDVSKLQLEEYRRMILRVLKGRFIQPGRYAKTYFNAAHNIFYGEHDWLPAEVAEKINPFDEETKRSSGKNIKTI